MDISIATLAATVVSSFLIPLIKKGSEKLAEKTGAGIGESITSATSDVATTLWVKVKSMFVSDEDKVVLRQFEQRPEAAKGLVEAMLKEKLESNSSLAQEFHELIMKAKAGGVSTGASVENAENVGIADARHSDFSHASGTEITGLKVGDFPTKNKDR